jgi:uncharacterized membrane protein YfcA
LSALDLTLIALVFVLAGTVKGTIGFGLPTVAIGLLTALIGLREALVIMLVPSLATNLWQAMSGNALKAIFARLWPLMLCGAIGTWFGVGFLVKSDALLFSGLLGILLCLYAVISLLTPQMPPPGDREKYLTPAVGLVTGVLAGLTGTYVLPSALYLQALGLNRDVLIQALGIWFVTATLSLGTSLGLRNALPLDHGAASLMAVIPAIVGMRLGQIVRARVSEHRFRTLFFSGLGLLGAFLAYQAFGAMTS